MNTTFGLFGLICILFLFVSCSGDPSSRWQETDLMQYGLPVKIQAPANIEVNRSPFSGSEEFQLTGPKDYGMTVLVLDATTPNATEVKSELEELVKRGKYFSDFIVSEDDGFVYRISIDSLHAVYGFRKVKIQGGKQIIFQNPYMSKLTEEQARRLYTSLPE